MALRVLLSRNHGLPQQQAFTHNYRVRSANIASWRKLVETNTSVELSYCSRILVTSCIRQ
ncbi:hypothetical protein NEOLEDRAFT_1138851 [Neolentinus lepideus HHB14362 ss-1]|uniref:Uncharacterized protein n=1 Tax=Neolentinus lepideus HHB14362 ss-1 TaxID=1314782 RepID=A0A165Q2Z0_9AGAM|nr:hypothetical protein NEOLEDRAFT_1138851 [Neolentinus lepideus HHB14362 ss-1]